MACFDCLAKSMAENMTWIPVISACAYNYISACAYSSKPIARSLSACAYNGSSAVWTFRAIIAIAIFLNWITFWKKIIKTVMGAAKNAASNR